MKKFILSLLAITLPSCAFGAIDDAIQEIQTTLDDLHTAECIRECTTAAEVCLDISNGVCIDYCETTFGTCNSNEDVCVDEKQADCVYYTGANYFACMNQVYDECNGNCDTINGDCKQDCAEQAQECLTTDANCVADCIQEMENSLKEINIGG